MNWLERHLEEEENLQGSLEEGGHMPRVEGDVKSPQQQASQGPLPTSCLWN